MPLAVSTCGAKTTPGRCASIAASTSCSGAGVQADCAAPGSTWRALSTCTPAAMPPISRICDQRKLNQPLRSTSTCCWPANWRATASMPKEPLPGTTMAERAA